MAGMKWYQAVLVAPIVLINLTVRFAVFLFDCVLGLIFLPIALIAMIFGKKPKP